MDSAKKTKQKKKKDRKRFIIILFAVLLILAGIIVAIYPYAIQWIFNNRQQDLMDMWTEKKAEGHADSYEFIIGRLPDIWDGDSDEIVSGEITEEDIDAFFDYDYAFDHMIGILKIPDINMASPILVGDTKQNLNVGVCEVKKSVRAGEVGNYILAGHYSRVYGRHFNRIFDIKIQKKDENGNIITPGSSLIVETATGTYEYEAYERLQVKAEDAQVVPVGVEERMITLITCDYSFGEPYGRVVVRGLLKEET